MKGIDFAWDSRKGASNYEKHGVTFEEARGAFFDDFARLIPDPDHSEDEERFLLLGMSGHLRLLVVCHCYRENDHTIRIISARRANQRERRQYEGFRHA